MSIRYLGLNYSEEIAPVFNNAAIYHFCREIDRTKRLKLKIRLLQGLHNFKRQVKLTREATVKVEEDIYQMVSKDPLFSIEELNESETEELQRILNTRTKDAQVIAFYR